MLAALAGKAPGAVRVTREEAHFRALSLALARADCPAVFCLGARSAAFGSRPSAAMLCTRTLYESEARVSTRAQALDYSFRGGWPEFLSFGKPTLRIRSGIDRRLLRG